MNLTFLQEAEYDYLDAFDYYAERSEAAARAFVAEFENSISQVQAFHIAGEKPIMALKFTIFTISRMR